MHNITLKIHRSNFSGNIYSANHPLLLSYYLFEVKKISFERAFVTFRLRGVLYYFW